MPNIRGLLNGNWQGFVQDEQESEHSGASMSVVAYWAGFWAGPIAARLNTLTVSGESGFVPPPEESTLAALFVRLPMPGLWRNRYLQNPPQDFDAPAAPETATDPFFTVRVPFRPLGRTQFRFQPAVGDESVLLDHQAFLARPQFPRLWRTQFRFGATYDESFTPPEEFEHTPTIFVRTMRNPYSALLAAHRLHTFSPQDEDAPPEVPGEGVYRPVYRPRRR